MEGENLRVYSAIGQARLLNIKVVLDDKKVLYEGMVENAPQNVKNLKYSKVEMGSPLIYYVYSRFNEGGE